MLQRTRALLLGLAALAALSVTTLACGGGTQIDDGQPAVEGEVTSPRSRLKVAATIASVSLANQYTGASNVQISFDASEASAAASVEIASLVLVDASSGATVDTLTPSQPQVWNGSRYVTWDQRVTPGGDLKASYQLSSPDWSSIDGSRTGSTSRTHSYSTPFKLRVTLRIDGVELVLESGELRREPEFVT